MKNHLLIAGATGSGKSYLMREFIPQLGPADLVILDTKKIEWTEYEKTAYKYADDIESAVDALDEVIATMDARFIGMKQRGERLYSGRPIYIIVDELADLMWSDKKQVFRQQLGRIAMIGRAAKVILIAGTQIATQDVIPAMIKSNCPNKICLRQDNKQKYRYILDGFFGSLPAEYGYCYLSTPGMTRPALKTTADAEKILAALD